MSIFFLNTIGKTIHFICFDLAILLPANDMPTRGRADVNCQIITQRKTPFLVLKPFYHGKSQKRRSSVF